MTSWFDIETGPLPDAVLGQVKPEFNAPENYRDPEKIKAHIQKQEQEWKERAALDATTGRVMMIGVLESDSMHVFEGDEKEFLSQFWLWLDVALGLGHTVAGFCIFHFDLPFLVRRSYINSVKIPPIVFRNNRWQPWSEQFIDVAELWQCGNRDQKISLDMLSRSLGIGQKNGNGKDFAALLAKDRAKAVEYLRNDLELTRRCHERMSL